MSDSYEEQVTKLFLIGLSRNVEVVLNKLLRVIDLPAGTGAFRTQMLLEAPVQN